MGRISLLTLLVGALSLTLQAAPVRDGIWFCPGPGTLDYIRLFEHPEEWRHARALLDVFKFYQQHTTATAPAVVGPNSYDALSRAGAFRQLTAWGKKIALEVGAVKDYYCTPDASGMNTSIADTVEAVRAVERAGGRVAYIAMDEPFVSGRNRVCGGPALEPTADRVARYVKEVSAAVPVAKIGLIEAYPFSLEPAIESMLDLLRARGAAPAFLHIDIDLNAVPLFGVDLAADMRRLKKRCATEKILFGIIIWGNNGDSDVLYARDAERLLNAVTQAFPTWTDLPDHIIVQSWAESHTGLRITPTNLPEGVPYTHAQLLWDTFRRLRGQSGASTGTAVGRR